MKLNNKLIEQLKNGEIAVINDGTLEELREVLKAASKYPVTTHGHFKYYYINKEGQYHPTDDYYKLPEERVSINQFFKAETESKQQKIERLQKELDELKKESEFKVGDLVVVQLDKSIEGGNIGKFNNGFIGEILDNSEISRIHDCKWIILKIGTNKIIDKHLRPATPEEIELFKSPSLPEINNHIGRLTDDKKTLVYGCAELPMKWFKASENRKITSLTLDSGVTINENQINQIREYYDKVRKSN